MVLESGVIPKAVLGDKDNAWQREPLGLALAKYNYHYHLNAPSLNFLIQGALVGDVATLQSPCGESLLAPNTFARAIGPQQLELTKPAIAGGTGLLLLNDKSFGTCQAIKGSSQVLFAPANSTGTVSGLDLSAFANSHVSGTAYCPSGRDQTVAFFQAPDYGYITSVNVLSLESSGSVHLLCYSPAGNVIRDLRRHSIAANSTFTLDTEIQTLTSISYLQPGSALKLIARLEKPTTVCYSINFLRLSVQI